ncbi:vacuolar protein sorting-associated protein 54 [Pycnococcus provasolii]
MSATTTTSTSTKSHPANASANTLAFVSAAARKASSLATSVASVVNAGTLGGSWQAHEDSYEPPPPPAAAQLADISMGDLAGYIRTVRSQLVQFESDRLAASQASSQVSSDAAQAAVELAETLNNAHDDDDDDDDPFAAAAHVSELPSTSSTSSQEQASTNTQRRLGEGLVKAMQEVPEVFFRSDFDLSTPDGFAMACAAAGGTTELAGTTAQTQTQQERLTHYLDIVEVHLLGEIQSRSRAFFDAARSMGHLSTAVAATSQYTTGMRSNVKHLAETTSTDAHRVRTLHARRRNLAATTSLLSLVAEAQSLSQTLDACLETGDYGGCLDVHAAVVRLLASRDGVASSLVALRALEHRANDALVSIDTCMREEVRLASTDRLGLAEAPGAIAEWAARAWADEAAEANKRASSSSSSSSSSANVTADAVFAAAAESCESMVARLGGPLETVQGDGDVAEAPKLGEVVYPALVGLCRRGALSDTIREEGYTLLAAVTDAVKSAAEEVVGSLLRRRQAMSNGHAHASDEANDDDDDDQTGGDGYGAAASVGSKLSKLKPGEFLAVMHTVRTVARPYVRLGWEWREAAEQVAADSDVAGTEMASEVRHAAHTLYRNLSEEVARRIAALLSLRRDASHDMTLEDVIRLAHVVHVCAYELDAPAPSQNTSTSPDRSGADNKASADMPHPRSHNIVSTALIDCARAFVSAMRARHMELLAACMEDETFARVDVDADVQVRLDDIVCSVADGPTVSPEGHTSESIPHIMLGGETYASFRTVHVLITSLHDVDVLMRCEDSDVYTSLAPSLCHHVADMLRFFNARACSLVLSAGAMSSAARLKSITARHLAHTRRALSLLMQVHKPLRQRLIDVLSPAAQKASLPGFDRVARDLFVHAEEVDAKFVAILREAMVRHMKKLKQEQAPSDELVAAALTKEVDTLARILRSVLSPSEHEPVMLRVAALMCRHFATELTPLMPPRETAVAVAADSDDGSKAAAPVPAQGDVTASRAYREASHIISHVRSLGLDAAEAEEAAEPLRDLVRVT